MEKLFEKADDAMNEDKDDANNQDEDAANGPLSTLQGPVEPLALVSLKGKNKSQFSKLSGSIQLND